MISACNFGFIFSQQIQITVVILEREKERERVHWPISNGLGIMVIVRDFIVAFFTVVLKECI